MLITECTIVDDPKSESEEPDEMKYMPGYGPEGQIL